MGRGEKDYSPRKHSPLMRFIHLFAVVNDEERWIMNVFYCFVKKLFSHSVNILNFLLAGNLPPFVGVRVIIEEQGRYLVIESPKDHFTFPGGF